MLCSIRSAEKPSTTSQPERRVSEPSPIALRRNTLRVGTSRRRAASLRITPVSLWGARNFPNMVAPKMSAAADHSAETLGHGQGHHDMKNEKQKNRAHRQKMDDPRPVEIAEE